MLCRFVPRGSITEIRHWALARAERHHRCHNLSKAVSRCSLPCQSDAAPSGMDENHEKPPSPRNELELVNQEELSSLLKVCKRQLYSMRSRGEIPYFKLGRSVRFRVEEVLEELERLRAGNSDAH